MRFSIEEFAELHEELTKLGVPSEKVFAVVEKIHAKLNPPTYRSTDADRLAAQPHIDAALAEMAPGQDIDLHELTAQVGLKGDSGSDRWHVRAHLIESGLITYVAAQASTYTKALTNGHAKV